VFEGKYRVEAILGAGGMGVVAECTHLALNERVAIKMLRRDVLMDQDAVQRFIREAQAAVKLKSEYVADVKDVGTFENGVPYMVMEYLEGHDLGELLKQRGVLPVPWAVELMLQTAEALAEAHSLAIVHRDVKPTNLFVTWRPDGTALIKVLDFGISKSPTGTDMHLTQTQSLLGTPAYMSPEQMRSARLVDTRTDIWSLGTVFYEVLEGRRPFEAESFSEMCVKVAVDPPAPMVNAPPGLQQVILRCLAKAPEQRYPNMAEFARDLVPFSTDPHGAQMLVDRMGRMLRRSGYDWEGGSTGVGRQSLDTGPVRAQTPLPQFGVGSDPAGSPWSGKSDPSAKPWRADSQPFATPLQGDQSGFVGPTIADRKRSRWWIGVLLVLLVGGAGALAFGLTRQEQAQPASAAAPHDNDTTTPQQTEDVKVQGTQPDVSAGSDTSPAAAPPPPVEDRVEKKPKSKSGTKSVTKRETKTVKAAPVPEPPPEVKKEPEKKPCDPFGSMHGCK